jgi:hypothetical protein
MKMLLWNKKNLLLYFTQGVLHTLYTSNNMSLCPAIVSIIHSSIIGLIGQNTHVDSIIY